MKIGKLVASSIIAFLLITVSPSTAFAATLDEITSKQQAKQEEMAKLDSEVSQTLVKVNEKNTELENLNAKIEQKKGNIEQTSTEIDEQEEVVQARVDQAKERLQTIQTSEVNQNVIVSLFESESVSDLFNRAYILATLQTAGNDQLSLAEEEQEKLADLKEKLNEEAIALENQTQAAEEQKADLDKQVAGLQKTMDENQDILNELDSEKRAEETRIAEAKKAEEEVAAEKIKVAQTAAKAEKEKASQAAVQAKAEATKEAAEVKPEAKVEAAPAETKTTETASPKTEAKQPAESAPAASTGKTLVVSATGYSTAEAGLSTHTATGIDLRSTPMVIAVDPRVIPLGSMVEVPGYGVAIAGDTGGAIKGNKIDVHFSSVEQAFAWGRKTVTIKVLN
ncbi:MAG: 3D domain-containing protein [Carnobacterium sp.]|uniref:3D domain-containing protein n=1 Tax=Carnobacterium sp. TaxID=48221 RepID=UPI002FCB6BA7